MQLLPWVTYRQDGGQGAKHDSDNMKQHARLYIYLVYIYTWYITLRSVSFFERRSMETYSGGGRGLTLLVLTLRCFVQKQNISLSSTPE